MTFLWMMKNGYGWLIIPSESPYKTTVIPSYKWIKHSIGNKQSLINDQVNAIIEDRDGDLWFATNNGISFFNSKTGQWRSVLSCF